jgi:Transposase.
MDLSKNPERVVASVADFRRGLIRKITDQTVAELARERGISPSAVRKWKVMVERVEKTAASLEDTLVPRQPRPRARERSRGAAALGVGRQSIALRVLEEKQGIL